MATPSDSFIGISAVRTEQIDNFIAAHNASAPAVGEDYVYYGRKYALQAHLAAAMAVHETGYFTFSGQVPAWYHNPAGLKQSGHFMQFASWQAGIEAHYQRLVQYVRPGAWQYDFLMETYGNCNLSSVGKLWSHPPREAYGIAVANYATGIEQMPVYNEQSNILPLFLLAGAIFVLTTYVGVRRK